MNQFGQTADKTAADDIYSSYERMLHAEKKFQETTGDTIGYLTGFDMFDNKMSGLQPGMYFIGGHSNTGKTSFMLNVALSTAKLNPTATALYISIDDNFETCYSRLAVMQAPDNARMKINDFKHFRKFERNSENYYADFVERRSSLVVEMAGLFQKNLIVHDAVNGKNIEQIKENIYSLYEVNPNLIVFVDNFHKLRTTKNLRGGDKWIYFSEEIKALAEVELKIPVMCSVQYRKSGAGRPELDDVKESGDMIYDSNATILLYSDWQGIDDMEAVLKFTSGTVDRPFSLPIVEARCAKNKLSEYKGYSYFRFYPANAKYTDAPLDLHKEYKREMDSKDMNIKRGKK